MPELLPNRDGSQAATTRASPPDPGHEHEATLILRIQGGERELFYELVRPYEKRVFVLADGRLINLAAADDVIRERSIEAFRSELERAILMEAEYVVAHPGNYRGLALEQGIVRFLEGVTQAAAGRSTCIGRLTPSRARAATRCAHSPDGPSSARSDRARR